MVVILDKTKRSDASNSAGETAASQALSGLLVIPVASGKGGVGKSTVALYLALAFKELGFKVGLLDADIYGPSLPTMLNICEKPGMDEGGKVLPVVKLGLRLMSIAFFTRDKPDGALMWRGPMAQKALLQLARDTQWGDTQVLVVDMPPGTGDIQIALSQNMKPHGAVIVSTPQRVALEDAKKSIAAFETFNIPILGVVENMSSLFKQSHLKDWLKAHGYKCLASMPFSETLAQACDEGNPQLLDADPAREVFLHIAQELSLTFPS